MKKIIFILGICSVFLSCNQDGAMEEKLEAKKDKVQICHYDADSDSWKTIEVSRKALGAHLKHGDFEGACDSKTYIPDDGFEWYLVSYGYDDVMDDYVLTRNIVNIESMFWDDACCTSPWVDWPDPEGGGIRVEDMTGIQDFRSLKNFGIYDHPVMEYNIELDKLPALEVFTLIQNVSYVDLDFSLNPNLREINFLDGGVIGFVDLSNNVNMEKVYISSGHANNIDIRNGNNTGITFFEIDASGLICVEVDNVDYSNANWTLYSGTFSEDCGF